MKHIQKITPGSRDKYFTLFAASFLVLLVLSFTACSNFQSEQKQAEPAPVIHGDAIDAPAAASTPKNNAHAAQKPEELPAENLHAPAKNSIGKKSVEGNNISASAPTTASSPAATKADSRQLPVSGKNSTTAATPALENPAAAEASPATTSSPVITAPASNNSGYQRITLGLLGSFRYEYPDPVYLESEKDPAQLKLKDQFPPNLKALHGKKISIMGYIMPIDVDEEWRVKTFTLVRDQMVCCFGNVPEINEWVYVRLKTPQRADQLIDVPVIVFGTLEVGEEIQQGALANLYRIEADRVSTNY